MYVYFQSVFNNNSKNLDSEISNSKNLDSEIVRLRIRGHEVGLTFVKLEAKNRLDLNAY